MVLLFVNIATLIIYPFQYLIYLIKAHFQVSFNQFDPIVGVSDPAINSVSTLKSYRIEHARIIKYNQRYFILPFFVFLTVVVDSIWVLYQNDFEYFKRPIPEMFTHKMYPPKFWYQSDMIMFAVSLVCPVIYYYLWRGTWLKDKFCMYVLKASDKLIVNKRVWDKENSKLLRESHNKFNRVLKIFMACSHSVVMPYIIWNFARKQFTGVKHFVSLYFFLPILLYYCVFGIFNIFIYFMNASKYIVIKQRFLIARMRNLSVKLSTKPQNFANHRIEFRAINLDVAYQCAEVGEYNRFWSVLLTCLFLICIDCFCYMMYSNIFLQSAFNEQIYYLFYQFEMGIMIFVIITRCSMIDFYNHVFYKYNMKLLAKFQLGANKLGPRQLHNIYKIGTNQGMTKYCFRLTNSYRLDSTAFNMAIYIISTFFINLVKDRAVKQGIQPDKYNL